MAFKIDFNKSIENLQKIEKQEKQNKQKQPKVNTNQNTKDFFDFSKPYNPTANFNKPYQQQQVNIKKSNPNGLNFNSTKTSIIPKYNGCLAYANTLMVDNGAVGSGSTGKTNLADGWITGTGKNGQRVKIGGGGYKWADTWKVGVPLSNKNLSQLQEGDFIFIKNPQHGGVVHFINGVPYLNENSLGHAQIKNKVADKIAGKQAYFIRPDYKGVKRADLGPTTWDEMVTQTAQPITVKSQDQANNIIRRLYNEGLNEKQIKERLRTTTTLSTNDINNVYGNWWKQKDKNQKAYIEQLTNQMYAKDENGRFKIDEKGQPVLTEQWKGWEHYYNKLNGENKQRADNFIINYLTDESKQAQDLKRDFKLAFGVNDYFADKYLQEWEGRHEENRKKTHNGLIPFLDDMAKEKNLLFSQDPQADAKSIYYSDLPPEFRDKITLTDWTDAYNEWRKDKVKPLVTPSIQKQALNTVNQVAVDFKKKYGFDFESLASEGNFISDKKIAKNIQKNIESKVSPDALGNDKAFTQTFNELVSAYPTINKAKLYHALQSYKRFGEVLTFKDYDKKNYSVNESLVDTLFDYGRYSKSVDRAIVDQLTRSDDYKALLSAMFSISPAGVIGNIGKGFEAIGNMKGDAEAKVVGKALQIPQKLNERVSDMVLAPMDQLNASARRYYDEQGVPEFAFVNHAVAVSKLALEFALGEYLGATKLGKTATKFHDLEDTGMKAYQKLSNVFETINKGEPIKGLDKFVSNAYSVGALERHLIGVSGESVPGAIGGYIKGDVINDILKAGYNQGAKYLSDRETLANLNEASERHEKTKPEGWFDYIKHTAHGMAIDLGRNVAQGVLSKAQTDAFMGQNAKDVIRYTNALNMLDVDSGNMNKMDQGNNVSDYFKLFTEKGKFWKNVTSLLIPSFVQFAPSIVAGGFTGNKYSQGALTFNASFNMEYASKYKELLEEAGVDTNNEKELMEAFSNPYKFKEIRDTASKRGFGVGIFDALSVLTAGMLFKQVPNKTIRMASVLSEIGVQAGLGGLGEAYGSILAGDDVVAGAVLNEMVGEILPGTGEVFQGIFRKEASNFKKYYDSFGENEQKIISAVMWSNNFARAEGFSVPKITEEQRKDGAFASKDEDLQPYLSEDTKSLKKKQKELTNKVVNFRATAEEINQLKDIGNALLLKPALDSAVVKENESEKETISESAEETNQETDNTNEETVSSEDQKETKTSLLNIKDSSGNTVSAGDYIQIQTDEQTPSTVLFRGVDSDGNLLYTDEQGNNHAVNFEEFKKSKFNKTQKVESTTTIGEALDILFGGGVGLKVKYTGTDGGITDGEISKVNEDGTFDIKVADNKTIQNVDMKQIKIVNTQAITPENAEASGVGFERDATGSIIYKVADIKDKAIQTGMLRPFDISINKENQFRTNANDQVVDNRLEQIKSLSDWDVAQAGAIHIYYNKNTDRIEVYNGHHRLVKLQELIRKAGEEALKSEGKTDFTEEEAIKRGEAIAESMGKNKISVQKMDSHLDNSTDARLKGALINLGDGTVSALDMAVFLRSDKKTIADFVRKEKPDRVVNMSDDEIFNKLFFGNQAIYKISSNKKLAEDTNALSRLPDILFDSILDNEKNNAYKIYGNEVVGLSIDQGVALGKIMMQQEKVQHEGEKVIAKMTEKELESFRRTILSHQKKRGKAFTPNDLIIFARSLLNKKLDTGEKGNELEDLLGVVEEMVSPDLELEIRKKLSSVFSSLQKLYANLTKSREGQLIKGNKFSLNNELINLYAKTVVQDILDPEKTYLYKSITKAIQDAIFYYAQNQDHKQALRTVADAVMEETNKLIYSLNNDKIGLTKNKVKTVKQVVDKAIDNSKVFEFNEIEKLKKELGLTDNNENTDNENDNDNDSDNNNNDSETGTNEGSETDNDTEEDTESKDKTEDENDLYSKEREELLREFTGAVWGYRIDDEFISNYFKKHKGKSLYGVPFKVGDNFEYEGKQITVIATYWEDDRRNLSVMFYTDNENTQTQSELINYTYTDENGNIVEKSIIDEFKPIQDKTEDVNSDDLVEYYNKLTSKFNNELLESIDVFNADINKCLGLINETINKLNKFKIKNNKFKFDLLSYKNIKKGIEYKVDDITAEKINNKIDKTIEKINKIKEVVEKGKYYNIKAIENKEGFKKLQNIFDGRLNEVDKYIKNKDNEQAKSLIKQYLNPKEFEYSVNDVGLYNTYKAFNLVFGNRDNIHVQHLINEFKRKLNERLESLSKETNPISNDEHVKELVALKVGELSTKFTDKFTNISEKLKDNIDQSIKEMGDLLNDIIKYTNNDSYETAMNILYQEINKSGRENIDSNVLQAYDDFLKLEELEQKVSEELQNLKEKRKANTETPTTTPETVKGLKVGDTITFKVGKKGKTKEAVIREVNSDGSVKVDTDKSNDIYIPNKGIISVNGSDYSQEHGAVLPAVGSMDLGSYYARDFSDENAQKLAMKGRVADEHIATLLQNIGGVLFRKALKIANGKYIASVNGSVAKIKTGFLNSVDIVAHEVGHAMLEKKKNKALLYNLISKGPEKKYNWPDLKRQLLDFANNNVMGEFSSYKPGVDTEDYGINEGFAEATRQYLLGDMDAFTGYDELFQLMRSMYKDCLFKNWNQFWHMKGIRDKYKNAKHKTGNKYHEISQETCDTIVNAINKTYSRTRIWTIAFLDDLAAIRYAIEDMCADEDIKDEEQLLTALVPFYQHRLVRGQKSVMIRESENLRDFLIETVKGETDRKISETDIKSKITNIVKDYCDRRIEALDTIQKALTNNSGLSGLTLKDLQLSTDVVLSQIKNLESELNSLRREILDDKKEGKTPDAVKVADVSRIEQEIKDKQKHLLACELYQGEVLGSIDETLINKYNNLTTTQQASIDNNFNKSKIDYIDYFVSNINLAWEENKEIGFNPIIDMLLNNLQDTAFDNTPEGQLQKAYVDNLYNNQNLTPKGFIQALINDVISKKIEKSEFDERVREFVKHGNFKNIFLPSKATDELNAFFPSKPFLMSVIGGDVQAEIRNKVNDLKTHYSDVSVRSKIENEKLKAVQEHLDIISEKIGYATGKTNHAYNDFKQYMFAKRELRLLQRNSNYDQEITGLERLEKIKEIEDYIEIIELVRPSFKEQANKFYKQQHDLTLEYRSDFLSGKLKEDILNELVCDDKGNVIDSLTCYVPINKLQGNVLGKRVFNKHNPYKTIKGNNKSDTVFKNWIEVWQKDIDDMITRKMINDANLRFFEIMKGYNDYEDYDKNNREIINGDVRILQRYIDMLDQVSKRIRHEVAINGTATAFNSMVAREGNKFITNGVNTIKAGLINECNNLIKDISVYEKMCNIEDADAFDLQKVYADIDNISKGVSKNEDIIKNLEPMSDFVSVWENGERKLKLVTDPFLKDALTHADLLPNAEAIADGTVWVYNALKMVCVWARNGITKGIQFFVNNLSRDTFHAGKVSRGNFIPILSSLHYLIRACCKNDIIRVEYEKTGGSVSALDKYNEKYDFNKEIDSIMRDYNGWAKILAVGKKLSFFNEKLDYFRQASEITTRLANYDLTKKALKKKFSKMSDEDVKIISAFESRDITDFAMKGRNNTVNSIFNYTPFARASINGLAYISHTVRHQPLRFLRFGAGCIAMDMIFGFWEALAYKDDDDYKNLPDYIINNYSLIKVKHLLFLAYGIPFIRNHIKNPDDFIKIPMDFELGKIFRSYPKRIVFAITKSRRNDVENWLYPITSNLVDIYPLVYKTFRDVSQNKDSFRKKEIEPFFKTGGTGKVYKSRIYKNSDYIILNDIVGMFDRTFEWLFNSLHLYNANDKLYSPAQANYIVKSLSGSWPMAVLDAVDYGYKKARDSYYTKIGNMSMKINPKQAQYKNPLSCFTTARHHYTPWYNDVMVAKDRIYKEANSSRDEVKRLINESTGYKYKGLKINKQIEILQELYPNDTKVIKAIEKYEKDKQIKTQFDKDLQEINDVINDFYDTDDKEIEKEKQILISKLSLCALANAGIINEKTINNYFEIDKDGSKKLKRY